MRLSRFAPFLEKDEEAVLILLYAKMVRFLKPLE